MPETSPLLYDRREIAVGAPVECLFDAVSRIGGANGWYACDLLWQLRGLLDEAVGGVGLRRGRRHPTELAAGDVLDFWRVEELEAGRKVLLRAEMRLPGVAWLEFETRRNGNNGSVLIQTARFYPRGLLGTMYWYGIYPIHIAVFRRMARAIGKRAEARAAVGSIQDALNP